jgi:hypothetical protein
MRMPDLPGFTYKDFAKALGYTLIFFFIHTKAITEENYKGIPNSKIRAI